MPQYTPPLRDLQFVMHELLNAVDELKTMPRHKDIDAETINSVLEEGGKFAAGVIAPLRSGGRFWKSIVARAVSSINAVFSHVLLVAATNPRQPQRASASLYRFSHCTARAVTTMETSWPTAMFVSTG